MSSKEGWSKSREGSSMTPSERNERNMAVMVHQNQSAGSSNSSGDRMMKAAAAAASAIASAATLNYRRYGVGEKVLVCDPHQQGSSQTPSPSMLVNRFGYPPGTSAGAPEEHRGGPYVYVLATVQKVHFEEDSPFYSVARADTQRVQRADAEWMEPVLSARAEVAALKAANVKSTHGPSNLGSHNRNVMRARRQSFMNKIQFHRRRSSEIKNASESGHYTEESEDMFADNEDVPRRWWERMCLTLLCPIIFPYFLCDKWLGGMLNGFWTKLHAGTKRHALLCLNGSKPYSFKTRLTMVNILVLCSIWYMFIDQARLAFFSPSGDFGLSIISCIIWFILVLELSFEVFIRPSGYFRLLDSDKAFVPTTVRHISRFHLVFEVLSLVAYVPEFFCLFEYSSDISWNMQCGEERRFGLMRSTIMAILGPDREDVFRGRLYMALIRLRIFCLVRHWRNMWVLRNKLVSKTSKAGLFSTIFMPQGQYNNDNIRINNHNKVSPHNKSTPTATTTTTKLKKTRSINLKNRFKSATAGDDASVSSKDTDISRDENGKPQNNANEEDDQQLVNATNIGTALMLINSHRALLITVAIMGLLPVLFAIQVNGGANMVSYNMVENLQQTNIMLPKADDPDECAFFLSSVASWVIATAGLCSNNMGQSCPYLLWLEVLPARCNLLGDDGIITANVCNSMFQDQQNISVPSEMCAVWSQTQANSTIYELAELAGIRPGVITIEENSAQGNLTYSNGTATMETFSVTAMFNQNLTVRSSTMSSFLMQVTILIFVLSGLSVLRFDASRLVLDPLRRMIKIVSLYAKNPLSPPKRRKGESTKNKDDEGDGFYTDSDSEDDDEAKDRLGNYETEQLITTISKITDLLRKCWGVAGAGIISTNLARQGDGFTTGFNPCVPGKSVYALFGFAAIKGFDHQLRSLGGDIMILINDVAAVLHGEVFRWGFGNSGQCNKNLGAAFLMVFRIGDMIEVRDKLDKATNVIFSTSAAEKRKRKSNLVARSRKVARGSFVSLDDTVASASRRKKKVVLDANASMSLSLTSLPGINTFTDRAVIGFLKTYAGIYRDQKLMKWKDDFRLSAGVGLFSVDMIFGMDAGWAVEGAVGSEYKIDATYLSPHVNMASRMMSACKQYGVSILLSQSVEELLSDQARSKFRHLDTVTVKGSIVKQKIFTYDARHKGVDFFLNDRTSDQANMDAERYSSNIWNTDQDLKDMRRHVTDDFLREFKKGMREYLNGMWPNAIQHLKKADDIMVETVMEQGYFEYEMLEIQDRISDGCDVQAEEKLLRDECGDGPSRSLVAFMEKEGGIAPKNWKGYRSLTSK